MRHVWLFWGMLLGASCADKALQPNAPPERRSTARQVDEIKAAAHQDEPGHEPLPDKVRLSPEVIQAAGLKVAPVVAELLPLTVDVTGEVTLDPDRSAEVTARAPARIVDVRFKEGDWIKKNALLAVLESPELARARAAYTAASAHAHTAKQNATRLENLAQKGLASGQELATASAEARALEAEATAARQALAAYGPGAFEVYEDASRLDIYAPISGFILNRKAMHGQSVSAEHVLAIIANFDHAYFLGRLFEKDLSRVKAGSLAEVRLNAYPEAVFSGVVESIGKQMDPSARTVVARISIKNHDDLLKDGLFGTARLVIHEASPESSKLVVPWSAVTKLVDKDVVFVRQSDDDFEVHPVALGRSAAGKVEVLAGLSQGEQVVVDGVFMLKSTVLKSAFGEDD